jgi:hypothetical protein
MKVELSSTDSDVKLNKIPGTYFAMNDTITCGSWVDKGKVEEIILDASSTSRILGTIGGAVGGAAVGVSAMELFGNDLLASTDTFQSVGGQLDTGNKNAMTDTQVICSNLMALESDNKTQFTTTIASIRENVKNCAAVAGVPDECTDDWKTGGKYADAIKLYDAKDCMKAL